MMKRNGMIASADHRPRTAVVEARRRAGKRALAVLPVEHFACASIRGILRRSDCAQRWRGFNERSPRKLEKRGTRNGYGQLAVVGSRCTGCGIGSAHAEGTVPQEAPACAAPTMAGAANGTRTVKIGAGV